MNQRGVHSQRHNRQGERSLYYRSLHPPHRCQESDPDTVAAPTAQRQKVCEYRAKVPIHSRRRRRRPEGQVPAWHKGPILVGKICSIGRDRAPRRPWPAVTRSASRRSSESHYPRLLTVSAQHVPPQSPRARSGRHTTPRPQPALRARSRVGRRGAKGPNPPSHLRPGRPPEITGRRPRRSRTSDAGPGDACRSLQP